MSSSFPIIIDDDNVVTSFDMQRLSGEEQQLFDMIAGYLTSDGAMSGGVPHKSTVNENADPAAMAGQPATAANGGVPAQSGQREHTSNAPAQSAQRQHANNNVAQSTEHHSVTLGDVDLAELVCIVRSFFKERNSRMTKQFTLHAFDEPAQEFPTAVPAQAAQSASHMSPAPGGHHMAISTPSPGHTGQPATAPQTINPAALVLNSATMSAPSSHVHDNGFNITASVTPGDLAYSSTSAPTATPSPSIWDGIDLNEVAQHAWAQIPTQAAQTTCAPSHPPTPSVTTQPFAPAHTNTITITPPQASDFTPQKSSHSRKRSWPRDLHGNPISSTPSPTPSKRARITPPGSASKKITPPAGASSNKQPQRARLVDTSQPFSARPIKGAAAKGKGRAAPRKQSIVNVATPVQQSSVEMGGNAQMQSTNNTAVPAQQPQMQTSTNSAAAFSQQQQQQQQQIQTQMPVQNSPVPAQKPQMHTYTPASSAAAYPPQPQMQTQMPAQNTAASPQQPQMQTQTPANNTAAFLQQLLPQHQHQQYQQQYQHYQQHQQQNYATNPHTPLPSPQPAFQDPFATPTTLHHCTHPLCPICTNHTLLLQASQVLSSHTAKIQRENAALRDQTLALRTLKAQLETQLSSTREEKTALENEISHLRGESGVGELREREGVRKELDGVRREVEVARREVEGLRRVKAEVLEEVQGLRLKVFVAKQGGGIDG